MKMYRMPNFVLAITYKLWVGHHCANSKIISF